MKTKMTGVELISDERFRQKAREHYNEAHDDTHVLRELSKAAACYLIHSVEARHLDGTLDYICGPCGYGEWPFEDEEWKPKSILEDLVRAGALIAAEIDRLNRTK